MASSFFALFDDIATLLDDIAVLSKVAAQKTILVPLALGISVFLTWAITPLWMVGGGIQMHGLHGHVLSLATTGLDLLTVLLAGGLALGAVAPVSRMRGRG
jgi:hypothetical protein